MKMKAIVCVSIILVFATYQNVNADRFESEFKETLAHIFRERIVKSLLGVASLNEQNSLKIPARKNLVEVFSQGRAKGRNPDCPVLSETGKLYRAIRIDENCRRGLLAKDPYATHTISSHVGCGSKKIKGSQYISLSTSFDLVQEKYFPRAHAIVEVNVEDVPKRCKIIDLNDENIRDKHLRSVSASNGARKDCEVLIACKRNYVPCRPLYVRGEDNQVFKLRVSERLRNKRICKNKTG